MCRNVLHVVQVDPSKKLIQQVRAHMTTAHSNRHSCFTSLWVTVEDRVGVNHCQYRFLPCHSRVGVQCMQLLKLVIERHLWYVCQCQANRWPLDRQDTASFARSEGVSSLPLQWHEEASAWGGYPSNCETSLTDSERDLGFPSPQWPHHRCYKNSLAIGDV